MKKDNDEEFKGAPRGDDRKLKVLEPHHCKNLCSIL